MKPQHGTQKQTRSEKKVNVVGSWMKNGLRTKRIKTNNPYHNYFKVIKYWLDLEVQQAQFLKFGYASRL